MARSGNQRELVQRLILAELLAREGEGLLARRFPTLPRRPARAREASAIEPDTAPEERR